MNAPLPGCQRALSAALGPGTRAYGLVELAHAGHCALLSSSLAIEEARRNLAAKAGHALDRLPPILAVVETISEPPPALSAWAAAQGLPPKDAPILAAAVMAQANLLVTGDKRHFGHLFGRTLRGVGVVALSTGLRQVLESVEGKARTSRQDMP